MAARPEPARIPFARGVATSWPALLHPPTFSWAALLLAGCIAMAVVVLRGAGPDRSVPPLTVQVALPGIGAGAPADLSALRSALPSGSGALTPALYYRDTSVAVTAVRYAAHLTGDLVHVPEHAVAALTTPEQVEAAVTFAANPLLLRASAPEVEGVGGVSVLRARLGLSPGDPLPPYFTYEAQRGDTVAGLARRFGISEDAILFNNWELWDPDHLDPGISLTIPTADGVVYTVRLGDTLFDVIQNYDADMDATLAFPGNNLPSPDRLVEGSTILLVGGAASLAPGAGFSGPVFAIPDFQWPVGGLLSDFFGAARGNLWGFHTGIDLSAPIGTFIGAAAPGTVIQAGWDGSFGLNVLIDHGGGVITRYAHMDHIDAFLGEFLNAGDLVGFVGQTGLVTGPHLHFEIIMGGVPQDPLIWLNS